MIAVGEQTGRLEDTFRELEAYYETTLRVQREFRSQMTYPALQFVGAVFVVAGMTFVLGLLGSKMDPLGLGLTGTAGAVTILVVMFGFAGGILLLIKLALESVRWRSTLEGMGLLVPVWGGALLNFALHRFCIALRMTTEAGLRAEQVLKYSFRATANSVFQRGEAAAVAVAKKGNEIREALAASRAPFPEEFLESIEVAEVTGNMSEVAERMAENYRQEGSRRLKMAAEFTGYAIYAGMAIALIILIFKMAGTYFGAINSAASGM
jgi:type II secretory pathway component PulF